MSKISNNENSETFKKPDKLDELQQKYQNVHDTLINNLELVALRGDSLNNIEQKSEDLERQSEYFRQKTGQLKWKKCREHWRVIVIILLILIVIIIWTVFSSKMSSSN